MITGAKVTLSFLLVCSSCKDNIAWGYAYPKEISFNGVADLGAASVDGSEKFTETTSEVVNSSEYAVSSAWYSYFPL